MTNPYKILGVDPSDSDEKIKQAYRELARKYHPDKYADTDLAEMASEKMKEINAAYEEIQTMRKNGGSSGTGGYGAGGSSYSGGYSGSYAGGNAAYARIRAMINGGNLDDAQALLRAIPERERGAEWYYLMGCVLLRYGHLIDAQSYLDRACRLDPYNAEYRTVADRLRVQTTASAGGYRTMQGGGCSECDICSSLLCADCCCECMGGDLISCC